MKLAGKIVGAIPPWLPCRNAGIPMEPGHSGLGARAGTGACPYGQNHYSGSQAGGAYGNRKGIGMADDWPATEAIRFGLSE